MSDFEGTIAISFCLAELLDDICPAAAAYTDALVRLDDPEKIGLTLNEPHRKPMNRENIKRFQRHGVISAKHILVAQQIRKIGRKRVPDALIRYPSDHPGGQFQAEELPSVEHFPVVVVPPAMKPIGLVTGGDFVVRDIPCARSCPSFFGLTCLGQILGIRNLEESADVVSLAGRTVVFKREKPMLWRSQCLVGKCIDGPAVGACAAAMLC